MWFTSFARPSLSPSPAARGGAAVREGPAGRQLLPAPAGGGLCDKAAGWRSFLSPSPPVRERRELCVSLGRCRACPAPAVVPVRCRAAPPPAGRRAARRAAPFPLPCWALCQLPQPRFLTLGWLEVGIASPAANKSSATSAAPACRPRERSPRQLGASPGEAGREAGMRRERGRGGAGRSRTKRRGWWNVCVCASQTGSRTTSLTSCCFPDVTSET